MENEEKAPDLETTSNYVIHLFGVWKDLIRFLNSEGDRSSPMQVACILGC